MSYSYGAYGLSIFSSFVVPGLIARNTEVSVPDLSLEAGPEPNWVIQALRMPSRRFRKYDAEPETKDPAVLVTSFGEMEFLELAYSDGTRFVMDGTARRMWVQWAPPLTVEDFATYFLGPAMGFVLRRRGVTALHASTVRVGGHAIAFCGEAHAGKSTTAAALALRGVPVLCEDISALHEKNGQFWVESGYPRVCLWPDSVENLTGARNALPRLTPTWEKCYLPLDGVRARFEPNRQPLCAVYLFAARAEGENAPRIEELSPREALLELVQNTYMNWILDSKMRAAEFDVLARMVAQVPIRRVVPNSDPKKIGKLCELLLSDAREFTSEKMAVGDV